MNRIVFAQILESSRRGIRYLLRYLKKFRKRSLGGNACSGVDVSSTYAFLGGWKGREKESERGRERKRRLFFLNTF